MSYDSFRHHRQSIRMKGYDYASEGAYFVTICTKDREHLFGTIFDGIVKTNVYGDQVQQVWNKLPYHYPNIRLDEFVIMPNHIHGILWITGPVGAGLKPAPTRPGLFEIVRGFKTFTARHINQLRGTIGVSCWQRNYYERIIRDDDELSRIQQYIRDNPQNWDQDPENLSGITPPHRRDGGEI